MKIGLPNAKRHCNFKSSARFNKSENYVMIPAGLIENFLQQYKGCTIAHRQLVTDICVIKLYPLHQPHHFLLNNAA